MLLFKGSFRIYKINHALLSKVYRVGEERRDVDTFSWKKELLYVKDIFIAQIISFS